MRLCLTRRLSWAAAAAGLLLPPSSASKCYCAHLIDPGARRRPARRRVEGNGKERAANKQASQRLRPQVATAGVAHAPVGSPGPITCQR